MCHASPSGLTPARRKYLSHVLPSIPPQQRPSNNLPEGFGSIIHTNDCFTEDRGWAMDSSHRGPVRQLHPPIPNPSSHLDILKP